MRQLRLRYRLAAQVADGYVEAGFTAVLQDIALGDELLDLMRAVRTPPRYVVVLAPRADVVARREVDCGKTGYAGDWSVAELDRAEETPRLGLWLDTSDLTVAATVDAILANLTVAAVDDD